jgi:predicted CXXCH cytochrome family protein
VKSIQIIVLSALFLLPASAQAITRRADKECRLCHVLWFDAFRTTQRTLIGKRDSAIVVAGSVGLVSSEEMCISCHDGYVVDSRVKTVKGNLHYSLKKLPDWLKLPEIFRLDSNNELYCGTCHTLHDIDDRAKVGSTPFMRMENERSQMCIACHDDKSRRQGYLNHPLLKKANSISPLAAANIGAKFGPDQVIICQSCHSAHGKRALVLPSNNSALCLICHQNKKSLINGKHDLRLTLPDEKNIKGKRPAESGPCSGCHIPHNGAGEKLWAKRRNPNDTASQMCLVCHGEQSRFKTKRIGTHSHPTNVKFILMGTLPKELPLFAADATKDPAGRVQCFTCHNVHQWDPHSAENPGGKDVEGDGSNSFLRISNGPSSTLCLACHQDKKQLLTSDHNLEVTAPDEKNIQELTARVSGPCGACHIPHNAAGKRLWAKPLPAEKDFTSALCVGCHSKTGAAKEKLVGDNSHPLDVFLGESKIRDIREQVAKELPLYSGDGERMGDGKIVCITCHEPHVWDLRKPGILENYEWRNMEGDASTSFLRKVNSPAPELCETCHPNAAAIEGTPHDLRERSSKRENMSGQIFEQAGLCEACHLVHNARSKLKIWATPLGPTLGDQNPMNGLCTSCHSKGNMAENRTPPIAIHPSEKLITNVVEFSEEGQGYTRLFGPDGKERKSGNLSCPSCHNAHQWGIPIDRAAIGNKPKGNLTKSFRFLRPMSYNAVCRECHGDEGILRYMFFHDPQRRSQK